MFTFAAYLKSILTLNFKNPTSRIANPYSYAIHYVSVKENPISELISKNQMPIKTPKLSREDPETLESDPNWKIPVSKQNWVYRIRILRFPSTSSWKSCALEMLSLNPCRTNQGEEQIVLQAETTNTKTHKKKEKEEQQK